MALSFLQNIKSIEVIGSPHSADTDFPWVYAPNDFCVWVWEVFLEGYKNNTPTPTLEEAYNLVTEQGYKLRVVE